MICTARVGEFGVDTSLNASISAEPAFRQRCLDSKVIFAGGRELTILHHGEPYCLRETRQGKLILTK
jgi:hemin uptake protein HemP